MAYSGLGTGTQIDPFQITTASQYLEMSTSVSGNYWKIMNDIDFSGSTSSYIGKFSGYLDGDDHEMFNMPSKNTGFILQSNSSVENIKMRYNWISNGSLSEIFAGQGGLYTANVIRNIHIITESPDVTLMFMSDNALASCTLSNIILEGQFSTIIGAVYGLVENLKVYRNYNITSSSGSHIVGTLGSGGIMRRCQHIAPSCITTNTGTRGFLVGQTSNNNTIEESFALIGEVDISAATSQQVNMLVGTSNVSGTVIVKNCYFKGNVRIPNNTANAYAISPNNKLENCFFWGEMDTPLFNNRTILSINITNVSDCYYNKDEITQITPLDVARQKGLTTSEFADEVNFINWDFDNIWEMGAETPVLQFNPFYNYNLDPRPLNILSIVRNSSSQITVTLSTLWTYDVFGLDVFDGETLIYSQDNNLINTISVDSSTDHNYYIRPYWIDGKTHTYSTSSQYYYHYSQDIAIAPPTLVEVLNYEILIDDTETPAKGVHGSCIIGDYVYGSTRLEPGRIIKSPIGNPSAWIYNILYRSEVEDLELTLDNLDQMVVCGDFIYTLSRQSLIQIDPSTLNYKVFGLNMNITSEPLCTDGTYLYVTAGPTSGIVRKIHHSEFLVDSLKWNPSFTYTYTECNYNTQGGHILGGYLATDKGEVHSSEVDEDYIYLAFTSGSEFNETLDSFTCEIHKINKHTMTVAGWSYIPKCTDDMCQNSTHLFLGIELKILGGLPTYPNALGRSWGQVAVRKSDMRVTGLPVLHSREYRPIHTSYASLIFGNYLLDSKTSGYVTILDISDPDNWSPDEAVGLRTLKVYSFTKDGLEISSHGSPTTDGYNTSNEFLLHSSGVFEVFVWGTIPGSTQPQESKLFETYLPDFNFFNNIRNINNRINIGIGFGI